VSHVVLGSQAVVMVGNVQLRSRIAGRGR
jgi:hypothetical protein